MGRMGMRRARPGIVGAVVALALVGALWRMLESSEAPEPVTLAPAAEPTTVRPDTELVPIPTSRGEVALPAPLDVPAAAPAAGERDVLRVAVIAVAGDGVPIPGVGVSLVSGKGRLLGLRWPASAVVEARRGAELVFGVSDLGWGSVEVPHVVGSLVGSDVAHILDDPTVDEELVVPLAPSGVTFGTLVDCLDRPVASTQLVMLIPEAPFAASVTTDLLGRFPAQLDAAPEAPTEQLAIPTVASVIGAPSLRSNRLGRIALESADPLVLRGECLRGVLLRVHPPEADVFATYATQWQPAAGGSRVGTRTAEGVFVEHHTMGASRLRVGAEGWVSPWFDVLVDETSASNPIDVTLAQRGTLRGRVVDARGAPVVGAWVGFDRGDLDRGDWEVQRRIFDHDAPLPKPSSGSGVVATDTRGRFALPFGLGRLLVMHPAYRTAVLDDLRELPDPIALVEGPVLAGRLVGYESLATPARVSIEGPPTSKLLSPLGRHVVSVHEDGSFRAGTLLAGRNRLLVEAPDGRVFARTAVDVAPFGTTSVVVDVRPPQRLRVFIADSAEALDALSLHALESERRTSVESGTHDGDTWFVDIDWTGPADVYGERGDESVLIGTIVVADGVLDHVLTLPTAEVHVEGVPIAASGQTPVLLELRRDTIDGPRLKMRFADSSGRAELRDIPAGTYFADVRGAGMVDIVARAGPIEVPATPHAIVSAVLVAVDDG